MATRLSPRIRNNHATFAALLLLLIFSVKAFAVDENATTDKPLLVDSDWLHAHLQKPGIVIVDVRSAAEYQQSHIAGAVNLPVTRTDQQPVGNRVVSQADIEAILGDLGIGNDSHVIVYGSALYQDAARVFWVLDLYGHRHLALLNGAFPAWQAAGLPVDTRQGLTTPVVYRSALHPGKMATRFQVFLAIDDPDTSLVDARETTGFQGINSHGTRNDRIPTAISIPTSENLEVRQGVYYLKPVAALEKRYAGVVKSNRTIMYCQSGRESAIGFLALRLLGKKVSLYDGAWQEWSADSGLPVIPLAP